MSGVLSTSPSGRGETLGTPEKWLVGCVAVLMIALRGQQQPHGTVRDPHLSRTAIAELGCGF